MGTAKKNLVLIVWFLFTLSLILSLLAPAGYGIHALNCHDADCAVCNTLHTMSGILNPLKNLLSALPILAVFCFFMLFTDTPNRVLAAFTPIAKKTKQTI